jgi:PAS domain S-box-containing protein
LLAAQAVRAIDDARLVEVAERRAARFQRLQEVGGSLAPSLDERQVQRELARHVQRVLPCRGVVIAHPNTKDGTVTIALHMEGGVERERGVEPLGPGVLAEVARTGRPVLLSSVGPDAVSLAAVADLVGGATTGVGSVLAAPMLVGHRLIGVVAVYGAGRTAFNAEDEELLNAIASQAASAIINARLYEESERERRQSEALSEIARAVGGSLRVSDVLRLIQRHATALLHANGATVMLRKGEYLHVIAASGSCELLAGMYLPLRGSVAGRAVRTGDTVVSNDARNDPDSYHAAIELASIRRGMVSPLKTEQGVVGAIAVVDRQAVFTAEDARVLTRLADQVAVALVNARLYEEGAAATRELGITFESIAGGLVVVDDDGRLQRCNRRATHLLGADDEGALQGRDFTRLLFGEQGADVAWPVTRAISERTAHRGTVRSPVTGLLYDLVASPHPNGGAVVFLDDVTAFHALADRYRDLMERASDAIYTLDADAAITSANAATAALLDHPRDDLVGRSLAPFLDPAESGRVREHFRAAMTGEARAFECHLVRSTGARRLLSVSNTPIRQGDEIVGVLGIARDVTVERALAVGAQRADALYARLVESASDQMFTVDEEGQFTSVNAAVERFTGRARADLLGRHFTEIIDAADRGTAWQMFTDSLKGQALRHELTCRDATGAPGLVDLVMTPMVEADRVVGVLGVARDSARAR